jgi:hypothetical protein
MIVTIAKIVYDKGMSAKALGHMHERNACLEVLQNILISTGIYNLKSKPPNVEQITEIAEIKEFIQDLAA